MATKQNRMALTLPADIHQALKDLSDASGTAANAFVVEMLTEALPAIRSVTASLILAKTDPGKALRNIANSFIQAQIECGQTQLELLNQERTLRRARGSKKKKKEALAT